MRERKLHFMGIGKDEGAAALTEFVIVIPVVLLFFLAVLQYFVVVRTSQLCNYAAYCAARVYAVQAAVDSSPEKEQAYAKAKNAAAIALSPVSHLVPGEIAGKNLRLSRSSQEPGAQLVALAEGWLTARYVRLNPKFGGSVKIETGGSPLQVNVEINYPQPIYIPGLAELWGIVGGGGKIKQDLRPLREGLAWLTGASLNAQQEVESRIERLYQEIPPIFQKIPGISASLEEFKSTIGNYVGDLIDEATERLLPFPYINVRAKCSMGYEDWGALPEWRPRKRGDGEEDKPDPAYEEKKQELDNARKRLEAATETLKQRADELENAEKQVKDQKKRVEEAEAAYNSTPTPEAGTKLASAKQRLRELENERDRAKDALNQAQQDFNNAREKVEAAYPHLTP
jgi:Flp pilus assembly protein TadG